MRRTNLQRQRALVATTLVTSVLFAASFTTVIGTSSASADVAPDATSTTVGAPTTTAAPAATAVAKVIDTTTTVAPTTTAAPTTTTTQPQTEVLGTAVYNTACHNTLLGPDAPADNISFTVHASALSPVQTGDNLVITNQHWDVVVPASLADTLRSLGVSGTLASAVTVTVAGTNVAPGIITTAPITSTIDFSGAAGTDATGSFNVPNMTFVPTGGTATFTLDAVLGISTDVTLPIPAGSSTAVTLTCLPTSGGDFLSVDTYGAALPTTTTTPRSTTTIKGTSGTSADTTLPITGANSHTVWTELLAALVLIQVGLLCLVASRRKRAQLS